MKDRTAAIIGTLLALLVLSVILTGSVYWLVTVAKWAWL